MSAALLSAVAASVAAVLSGLSLWATTQNAERVWRRDAVVEVLVEFLDASFRRPGTNALRTRATGGDLTIIKAEAQKALEAQVHALTRLRLLATSEVVLNAVALHDLENVIQERVLSDAVLPAEPEWHALYEARRRARTELIESSRKHLHLGKGKEVEEGRWRPPLFRP